MEYKGRYKTFDPSEVSTYPVSERVNKVTIEDLVNPEEIIEQKYNVGSAEKPILELARKIIDAREKDKPVIWFTGAHLIKNGLGPIVIDLIKRGIITLVAGNGAVGIHDFELALIGETSEYVPNALPEGKFGMATELSYINAALIEGNKRKLGYGESLGAFMHDPDFKTSVEKQLKIAKSIKFQHPEVSVIYTCFENNIPLTIHVGIGTDVIDQHKNFDGEAKGGCSGRDFLIYVNEVTKLSGGGVALNIGSAVTGPEVLLKAVSMAGNIGYPPTKLVTADFDLKPYKPEKMSDESSTEYYFRDHKSVATRIPQAFGGVGFYIQGNQKQTIPRLYQEITKLLNQTLKRSGNCR